MAIFSYAPIGYEGVIVSVKADIRRGLPGVEIVGIPASAVREARERIRAAVRNSGLDFPQGHIRLNLAPAGVWKDGAGFDLSLAAAILRRAGALPRIPQMNVLILGELTLTGEVRPVSGVVSAVVEGRREAISAYLVPRGNLREARIFGGLRIFGIRRLSELPDIFYRLGDSRDEGDPPGRAPRTDPFGMMKRLLLPRGGFCPYKGSDGDEAGPGGRRRRRAPPSALRSSGMREGNRPLIGVPN